MAVKPRVVLSRCLELDACRYNGAGIRSAVVRALGPWVEWVPVCPEVEIGLGVPRAPIRIERRGELSSSGDASLRLIEPSTGRDLTTRMRAFADRFADAAGAVDGVLLKSRSPSCGVGDVKVYAGGGAEAELETTAGTGMFAAVLRARLPDVAVADEVRLTARSARDEWLARVFASARARSGSAEARSPGYPRALASALAELG